MALKTTYSSILTLFINGGTFLSADDSNCLVGQKWKEINISRLSKKIEQYLIIEESES